QPPCYDPPLFTKRKSHNLVEIQAADSYPCAEINFGSDATPTASSAFRGAAPHASAGPHARRARTASRSRPLSSSARLASGGGERRLRLLDDGAEGGALVHRQIGHDLAVELDPGKPGTVDELRVAEALGTHRRVDPLDPQRTEVALL